MGNESELTKDGEGLAVIRGPVAFERFLVAEGLPAIDLELPRLGAALSASSVAAQAGSVIAAGSGRWVQMTSELA